MLHQKLKPFYLLPLVFIVSYSSCRNRNYHDKKDEQISLRNSPDSNSVVSGLKSKGSLSDIINTPNSILLTGLDNIRLVPIYKITDNQDKNILNDEGTTFTDEVDMTKEGQFKYFMPGIDIIRGYNLINVAHYNLNNDSISYFFEHPALIRTLYFPGLKKDSINNQLAQRNYFIVSAYDEDTNNDSVISKRDLRHIYLINDLNTKKTNLLPENYSAIRSTYDYKNDIMYINARLDQNKNGSPEYLEPVSIFYINLKKPDVAKKLY